MLLLLSRYRLGREIICWKKLHHSKRVSIEEKKYTEQSIGSMCLYGLTQIQTVSM